jgi:hypothetical protein
MNFFLAFDRLTDKIYQVFHFHGFFISLVRSFFQFFHRYLSSILTRDSSSITGGSLLKFIILPSVCLLNTFPFQPRACVRQEESYEYLEYSLIDENVRSSDHVYTSKLILFSFQDELLALALPFSTPARGERLT